MGGLTFLVLSASSKSHATLLTADYRHLIAYDINAQGWKKRLGLEGVGGWEGGGGEVHFKNCYCQGRGGGYNFHM